MTIRIKAEVRCSTCKEWSECRVTLDRAASVESVPGTVDTIKSIEAEPYKQYKCFGSAYSDTAQCDACVKKTRGWT